MRGGTPRNIAHTFVQEVGRAYVLTFGYFATAIVSAVIAASALVGYSYLVKGVGRAGLPVEEMIQHAVRFGLITTVLILALSVPLAWIPLSASLAVMRRRRARPFVACLASGVTTGLILTIWDVLVARHILPQADSEPIPFWLVVAHALPFAIPAGAIGGVTFWALCYRSRQDTR